MSFIVRSTNTVLVATVLCNAPFMQAYPSTSRRLVFRVIVVNSSAAELDNKSSTVRTYTGSSPPTSCLQCQGSTSACAHTPVVHLAEKREGTRGGVKRLNERTQTRFEAYNSSFINEVECAYNRLSRLKASTVCELVCEVDDLKVNPCLACILFFFFFFYRTNTYCSIQIQTDHTCRKEYLHALAEM